MSAGSKNIHVLSVGIQVAITAVICSLVFFTLGLMFGIIYHHWPRARCTTCKSSCCSPTPPPPVVYEDVSLSTHSHQVKSDIALKENVAYGPI